MALDFELDRLIGELNKIEPKPKRVLVQLPEGVKQKAFEIEKALEKLEIEGVFSGETVWGGCCIATNEAEIIGADLIVHFGHAKFIESNSIIPIIYMEIKDDVDLIPFLEKSLEKLEKYTKIGLSFSIQHRHDVERVIEFYKRNGKEVILSEKKGHSAYEGHVVGCEYGGLKTIKKKVDAFLVIGNRFHGIGASLAVEKPVFLIDVYNEEVSSMEDARDKFLKQRIVSIGKFKNAWKIGVISEIKPGQKFGNASFLLNKLRSDGKEVILININEITPDKLKNFYNVEAFVELGCPRIAIDDFGKYDKPIITFKECLVALGEKDIDEAIEEGLV